ncbi:MAG: 2-C-methyl-D-erythritol 2,4-cyclodiphosphate synthase [Bacilli bacterium]|nr:2-C-methyl-D-erythritol 2,4-cyclodiphosphate synthase [Bacilli bacterium]
MYRIGFSKDIHKLVKGRKLMLAGIHIPFNKGELAHSDGDVIMHAVAEAMLGATTLGDLGTFYPTNDRKYKDIASKEILIDTNKRIHKLKYQIENVDVSVELDKPKLAPYISKMRNNLAKILKVKLDQISIKANTNEGLCVTGKGEAVIAYAIVLLKK